MSSSARRALLTASGHVCAVMMIFAMTLSKSDVTIAGKPGIKAVSTRVPTPDGKLKDWILPMLSE